MTTEIAQEVAVSTWSIDAAHSSVHFKIRYLMIGWVHGEFRISQGKLDWNEDNIEGSSVEVEIDASSVYSSQPKRDEHLRNADFLDVERFPSINFRSTRISRLSRDSAVVSGSLSMHGVCCPVELRVTDISAPTRDPKGNVVVAASATARINRKDFGLTWNTPLETGGLLVGDEILLDLDVAFMKAAN